jgi:hypothetical protein
MTLVDHHEVVLINRRRFGIVLREQDAFDESLNGANVHLGLGFRCYVAETFQAKNIRESLDAHDFGRPEFRLGLLSEGVAVDDETNAPEALGGEQAVE